MLGKAATLAADQVFLDLEDAVSPLEKVDARAKVVDALRTHDYSGKVRVVRVNGVTTRWCLGDITAVGARGRPPPGRGGIPRRRRRRARLRDDPQGRGCRPAALRRPSADAARDRA
jgi:hypothetical protein